MADEHDEKLHSEKPLTTDETGEAAVQPDTAASTEPNTDSESAPAPEPAIESDGDAPATETPQEKKNRKPLFITLGIVAAAAVIFAAVFAINGIEDAGAKTALEDAIAEDPIITERVIPSTWGDQSGFKATSVSVKDFDRGLFAPDATASLYVKAENGSYELKDFIDVQCEKQGSDWKITQAEVIREEYAPTAPVSDEALLAHLPEIMAKADEGKENLAYINPPSVADFFGIDTEAAVLSNELTLGEDEAQIKLTRMIDGVAHEGTLDVVLEWEDNAEPPDWEIDYVLADEEAEGAIGSVVRDGVSGDVTASQQADIDALEGSSGRFWSQFQQRMDCVEGSPYCFIGFANLAINDCDMQFSVTSNETGETLYESPVIPPDSCLDYFRLAEPLEPGEHSVTVQYTAFGDGWRYANTTETDRDCMIYTKARSR